MMDAFLEQFFSYFSIRGRSSRKPVWIMFMVVIALWIGIDAYFYHPDYIGVDSLILWQIAPIPGAILAASIPLIIRRFHDLGRSGWFIGFLLVPIINLYFLIELLFFAGQASDPEYIREGSAKLDDKLSTR
jgi:uncharacterized membrane protein YhaH (DUF805 family)